MLKPIHFWYSLMEQFWDWNDFWNKKKMHAFLYKLIFAPFSQFLAYSAYICNLCWFLSKYVFSQNSCTRIINEYKNNSYFDAIDGTRYEKIWHSESLPLLYIFSSLIHNQICFFKNSEEFREAIFILI